MARCLGNERPDSKKEAFMMGARWFKICPSKSGKLKQEVANQTISMWFKGSSFEELFCAAMCVCIYIIYQIVGSSSTRSPQVELLAVKGKPKETLRQFYVLTCNSSFRNSSEQPRDFVAYLDPPTALDNWILP